MATLQALAADLAAGRTTSQALVEACLERIADPDGEGTRAFVAVDDGGARTTARAMDALRAAGSEPSPLAGIPVSVKDLFDVRGQVTRAGSRVLDGPPAAADAPAVVRWRRAGLVLVGRTNMTEFAYSGLGLNPHYGTPANPWDRAARRIPGGSTSGGAVSVSDGMAHGALGSDTGGSCRIPAALCGLVGWKPTQAPALLEGVAPLSASLDTVGVIARSVACCAALDERPLVPLALAPRLAVVRPYLLDDAEPAVASAFERAIGVLRAAGADVHDLTLPELDSLAEMNAGGGFPAAEAYAWHHDLLATRADGYDPRVSVRIRRGEALTARDLIVLRERRAAFIAAVGERLAPFDAFLAPTVPLVAPPIAALEDDAEYARVNLLMLRNPTVVNLLDGCAASVPMHRAGEPPTGLMVAGPHGADERVLRVAAWIEEQL
jgi:aspartyl-tRNA(Asn)/glutamyl-tRNA(Gln) amidotransferase subunit A